jgi:hypothetical protein
MAEYRRRSLQADLQKRIELINWVLERMKNPNVCEVIESNMNETIEKINKKESIIDKDPLDSELRILDWIFYQVCKDQQAKLLKQFLSSESHNIDTTT